MELLNGNDGSVDVTLGGWTSFSSVTNLSVNLVENFLSSKEAFPRSEKRPSLSSRW